MFLHCILQSSVALPLCGWFFLTQRFLAPLYVVSADPNHLLGHRHQCCWGLGGLGLFVLCMLVFMAYPSTLANAGWKVVPKLEYQA